MLTLLAPGMALAAGGTGGSGVGAPAAPSTTTTSSTTSTTTGTGADSGATVNPLTQAADQTVSASGDGITLQTTESGLYHRTMTFSGTVPAGDSGQIIEIERQTPGAAKWLPTAHATVGRGGTFAVAWHANRSGQLDVKAVLAPASAQAASAGTGGVQEPADLQAPTAVSPSVAITVYALSRATLYGPGFYGHQTACGETLTRSTIGVASRTLPCGTKVTIYYDRRTLTVPVIDRGPYANGADWDLTMATGRALGITETEIIGAEPASAVAQQ